MTEFERAMLTNMMNNGLNSAELQQFLANTQSAPVQPPVTQVQTQPTTPNPQSNVPQGGADTNENTQKGGETNVDLKQLMAMIEKQNETIAAIQAENMRQLQAQKPPETMDDILMNEFIKPMLERKRE